MADKRARWDDSRAKRSHANECAVSAGTGQFVVSFGISAVPQAGHDAVVVEVTQRVAMTPRVAKQLAVLLDRVLREYESRYGGGRAGASDEGREATGDRRTAPGQRGDSVGPI